MHIIFEGEEDKGGEVGKPLIEASEAKRYTVYGTLFSRVEYVQV